MNIDNLSYEAVETQSQHMDWYEIEEWSCLESTICDECGTITHERQCPKCGTEMCLDGPMMDYFYPLPHRFKPDKDTVDVLAQLPLCLANPEGKWGLALTGGGMDLTWEICSAYILLGYYPPFEFCDLPGMAGIENHRDYHEIVMACSKTCEAIRMRATRCSDKLRCMISKEKIK